MKCNQLILTCPKKISQQQLLPHLTIVFARDLPQEKPCSVSSLACRLAPYDPFALEWVSLTE